MPAAKKLKTVDKFYFRGLFCILRHCYKMLFNSTYQFSFFGNELHCLCICHYNYHNNPLSGLYLPYYTPGFYSCNFQIRILLFIIEIIQ